MTIDKLGERGHFFQVLQWGNIKPRASQGSSCLIKDSPYLVGDSEISPLVVGRISN